ncbi:uncharacterized protein LOC135113828 [Scylla paramamosain]|uniref:uncharacterized protein LOC135113828 n=1 Tax=Scylla paramamosain TaxID=85552 RepID=UPI0030832DBD
MVLQQPSIVQARQPTAITVHFVDKGSGLVLNGLAFKGQTFVGKLLAKTAEGHFEVIQSSTRMAKEILLKYPEILHAAHPFFLSLKFVGAGGSLLDGAVFMDQKILIEILGRDVSACPRRRPRSLRGSIYPRTTCQQFL